VIAATNRVDVLDPALLRSGRIDRKIEFPVPNEAARARIIEIHSSKFTALSPDVNYQELARCTVDFNGAQLKAVAVEGLLSIYLLFLCTDVDFYNMLHSNIFIFVAGMIALRRNATLISHEDFVDGQSYPSVSFPLQFFL
jgi:26S proteasome regulatory subunit T5